MCLQMRVERTPGSKRSFTSCVTLSVLVLTSLVGSTQAYSCTSDSHCQYEGCNDRPCYLSLSHCVNGKWKAYCGSVGLSATSCVSDPDPPNTQTPHSGTRRTREKGSCERVGACVACADMF